MSIPRRSFVRVSLSAAGGLLIGACPGRDSEGLDNPESSSEDTESGLDPSLPVELNTFVEVSPEGTVTVSIPTPEIGQGVRTALARIVADEMDADWTRVSVRQAEANRRYGSQTVGGSDSVRDYWDPLRRAGATAREVLKEAAARRWGVDVRTCETEAGTVLHRESNRRATYGELAHLAAGVTPPADISLKRPEDFTLIGRPAPGVDTADMVSGAAEYGLDVRRPGMLFAVITRSPVHGGRVASFDATGALEMPGVRAVVEVEPAVPLGELYGAVRAGVAVVAEDTWSAIRGREALEVRWTAGENVSESSAAIGERLVGAVREAPEYVLRDEGDPDGELSAGSTVVEAEYVLPPLAHLCMEPVNFTASARDEECDAWGPTQTPQNLQSAIAAQLGLPRAAVRVHPTLSGGGFGRRLAYDYGVEAAVVSRAVGAPVQVVWTREDDIRHDYFRPPSAHRLRAAIGPEGTVTAWEHHIATASLLANIEAGGGDAHPALYDVQGAADAVLTVPNVRVGYTPVHVGLQMGSWRSVSNSFNVFAVASFIDEVAAASGTDPYVMLRRILGDSRIAEIRLPLPGRRGRTRVDVGRLLDVLERAAERSGWGRGSAEGWGRGIACCEYKGSYAAHVAEVSSEPGGRVRVRRIVAVLDCGLVVDPTGVRAQVEGAAMDGVATVLHWGVEVRDGEVAQSNFHDYPPLRMRDAPEVEVHLLESSPTPLGAGEPPYPSVVPAITNAIFAATGRRIRTLPLGSG